MYINDVYDCINDDINVNTDELSIFMLLFADDLVLISKTPDGLQALLDKLYNYCIDWQLNVNLNKTKIVVFSKRISKQDCVFLYGIDTIEIVESYVYLGILFSRNGKFKSALDAISNQATRAIFGMKKCIILVFWM